jgi:hypothetical protein
MTTDRDRREIARARDLLNLSGQDATDEEIDELLKGTSTEARIRLGLAIEGMKAAIAAELNRLSSTIRSWASGLRR